MFVSLQVVFVSLQVVFVSLQVVFVSLQIMFVSLQVVFVSLQVVFVVFSLQFIFVIFPCGHITSECLGVVTRVLYAKFEWVFVVEVVGDVGIGAWFVGEVELLSSEHVISSLPG